MKNNLRENPVSESRVRDIKLYIYIYLKEWTAGKLANDKVNERSNIPRSMKTNHSEKSNRKTSSDVKQAKSGKRVT